MEILHTIWLHGTGGLIENPKQTLLLRHAGEALRIVGVAGSTNWLHYPFQLEKPAASAIAIQPVNLLLRYRCDSPTALITNVVLHDAEHRIFKAAGLNRCAVDWEEFVLNLGLTLPIRHSLNVSIGIRFDGADDETHALEISGVGLQFAT